MCSLNGEISEVVRCKCVQCKVVRHPCKDVQNLNVKTKRLPRSRQYLRRLGYENRDKVTVQAAADGTAELLRS